MMYLREIHIKDIGAFNELTVAFEENEFAG